MPAFAVPPRPTGTLPARRRRRDARGRGRAVAAAVAGVAAAVALACGGCGLLQAPAPDETVAHRLDARPTPGHGAVPRPLVLAVSAPRAGPGVDATAIAYVATPHGLDRYARHRWAEAPSRMLDAALLRTLEDSGDFLAVVRTTAGVAADLRLDTEIVQLRQSFLERPSRAELTLRVQLVGLPERRVLGTRYIEVAEPAPSDDAPGGVAAANAASARALAAVAAFCVDASAGRAPMRHDAAPGGRP